MAGNCVRCHAKDHTRATCKQTAGRWETKFDNEKDKYWAGTLKWQQKALAEPTSTKTKTPPTLVQKPAGFAEAKRKESRRQTFASDSDEDSHAPLQCRASSFPYWGVKTPPPESDDEAELTAADLREAIIESTEMRMIDYSDEEALLLLRSDPHFEVLLRTRHTSLVMLNNGTHGVFFNCDVDEARTSDAMQPSAHTRDESAPLTTDDGSRLLTPDEVTTLTTEVNTLVASLRLPNPSIPLVPRAPWMLDDDLRSDAEADAAWQSSSVTLFPSTQNQVAPPLPHPDDWLWDPDADVGLPFLRCYGINAVMTRLLADPGHRVVQRGDLTSLVKLSDETYLVLPNEDIIEATRLRLAPPPLPHPQWRQAQIDVLAQPPDPPIPWTVPVGLLFNSRGPRP